MAVRSTSMEKLSSGLRNWSTGARMALGSSAFEEKEAPDAAARGAHGHQRPYLPRALEDRHGDGVGHAEDDDAEDDDPEEAEDAVVERDDLLVERRQLRPVAHLQAPAAAREERAEVGADGLRVAGVLQGDEQLLDLGRLQELLR